jgi:hypothetical protein
LTPRAQTAHLHTPPVPVTSPQVTAAPESVQVAMQGGVQPDTPAQPATANGYARPVVPAPSRSVPAAACVLDGCERPPDMSDAGWTAFHSVCCTVPGCGGPGG